MKTLREFITLLDLDETSAAVQRHQDKKVIAEICPFTESRFPAPEYRNITVWVVLEDGSVCGFNENSSHGYNYIYKGAAAVRNYYKRYKDSPPKVLKNLL